MLTRHYDVLVQKRLSIIPGWVEEIIIVEDVPKAALRKSGKITIFSRPLAQDYAKQRNWALEKAKSEWTLFLDDDEVPSKNFFPKLWELLSKNEHSVIALKRNQVFAGKTLKHGDGGTQSLVRIAKTKESQGKWQGGVHEVWYLPDRFVADDLIIDHHNEPSLSDFLGRLHKYAKLDALERGTLPFSNLCFEFFLFPPAKFIFNYFLREGFRDGFAGFIHAWSMSYYSAIIRVYQYENNRS